MAKNYIDKEEFLKEILLHQEKIEKFYAKYENINDVPKNLKHCEHLMAPKLAKMIQSMVYHISRSRNFYAKPYIEDAIGEVTMQALKLARSFKMSYAIERGEKPNPFGYFTRCIQQAFTTYCNKENERTSRHLDYLIEEGRNMLESTISDDRVAIRNAIKPLIEIRNEVKGKWSVENMQKFGKKVS